MTTLPELLKDADPLNGERPNSEARHRRREAVLNAPPGADGVSRRFVLKTAVVGGALAALAAGGLLWSRASVDVIAAVRFEVRLAEESFAPGLREVAVDATRKIYLHQDTVITNSDIAEAKVVPGSKEGEFWVAVTFKAEGAERMRRATQDHLGKPVAILIDGAVVMAPTVRSAIGGEALISGDYGKAAADRIVAGIVGR